jgi:hypothetical protein
LDNTTLRKELTIQKCVDTLCYNITKFEDTVCNYGCDTERNECKSPPYITYAIFFGIVVVLIILYMIFR